MTSSERVIMGVIGERGFSWTTDKAHGLSALQARRALNSLLRQGRVRKTEALGAESYCAA